MFIHTIKDEFDTSLPANRIIAQMKRRLPDGIFDSDCEFFGSVTENSFKVWENLRYNLPPYVIIRNSFSPVATGRIEEVEDGSKVRLTLRINILVSAFIFIFELLSLLETLLGILLCIFGNFDTGIAFTIFPIFFILGWELLLYIAFRRPAMRLIERLKEILQYDYTE